MDIKQIKISDIIPYDSNPRKNDNAVDAVAASMKEFGIKQPLVIDSDHVIIAGHTRYLAAKKIGLNKLPCIIADDLSDEQIRAYRLADNKTHELAEWDFDLLAEELAGISDIDMSQFGFEDADIAEDEEQEVTEDDFESEPPAEPITKPGEIWQLGRHRLMCGDSTKSDDVARLMQGGRAVCCFTDPPWNVAIGKDSNPRHRQRKGLINDDMPSEEFSVFLEEFIAAVQPHLTGDMYCVLGASEWPTLDKALRGKGFHWSATIIWAKDQFVLGRSKYHRRYEPIWYGWQSSGKSSFGGRRDKDDVWEVARPRVSEEHPTMKPVPLVAKAVENSSTKGDIILDPFGGSGTTLIACEQLNRICYTMELDPGYCDVIINRWQKLTGQTAERVE